MKKIVLLDVDGVLADFVAGYLELIRNATGRTYARDQITEFNIGKALGLTDEESKAAASGIASGWCDSLSPMPGAVDGVRQLADLSEVYIVTSPWNSCPTWMSEREAWLKRHFGIHHSRVIHGSAKHLVRGDVLVDDKTSHVEEWNRANPGKTAVLWASPWNERDAWAGVATNSWARLHALVEAIS